MPVLATVATLLALELQLAMLVRSTPPSLKLPVALTCTAPPAVTAGPIGINVNETGLFTCSAFEPLTDPEVAVMLVLPAASALANPELLTLAVVPEDEAQVTVEVRSLVLLSL
jgi:hypothetical protein